MSDPVRILLVDDDEDDFLLTREMIQEAGKRFVVDWVPTYGNGDAHAFMHFFSG